MLERFTKERQRASKGAAFNLEDEDDLTHYGQSLSKMDDFDNVGLDDESEEETSGVLPNSKFYSIIYHFVGQIARNIVSKTHFGGFGDEEEEEEEEGVRLSRFYTSPRFHIFSIACKEEDEGRGYG